MSDLRFARELGAEFERIAQSRGTGSLRRRTSWPESAGARIATGVSIAIPVVVTLVAFALLSHSRDPRQGAPTNLGSRQPFALSGGNCRIPAHTAPHVPGGAAARGSDGLIQGARGRVAGIAWQLRTKDAEFAGAIEHGRLILGGHVYGLCSVLSVPVAFGLINSGAHGIIYGYVTEGADDRITISTGDSQLTTRVQDVAFFILALPRPACSYHALSVTATAPPVRGLPPDIDRSLNQHTPRFTTTLRFGRCRSDGPVPVASARGESQGRSPNAPLAHGTAQVPLAAPRGSHSRAHGTMLELTHDGQNGIKLLAFGLTPGRYRIWLLGTGNPIALASATAEHQLQQAVDLPTGVGPGRQIVVAHQPFGPPNTIGHVVLEAKLR